MSKRAQQKWIVKDSDGRIFGPFTSDQVLAQIDKGYFIGSERIASYPGGRWGPISHSPEFYDRLLDVLATEAKGAAVVNGADHPGADSNSDDIATSVSGTDPGDLSADPRIHASQVRPEPISPSIPRDEPALQLVSSTTAKETPPAVIELTDLKQLERKETMRSSKLPLILIASAVLLALVALLLPQDKSSDDGRIHLVMPRKGKQEISEAKVKEKFRKALTAFQADTFSGYQKAQNELVEAVEGAPKRPEYSRKKAELVSTLCLVYRELWPFAYQDARDGKVISQVMQEAKRLDPGGLNGALCEIVQLMTSGRYRDAQGLTESMLVEESQAPVLFEIRGDLYSSVQDYANAATYFAQAKMLWPAWQKIPVQEARARAKQQQFPQAIQLYQQVLQTVPAHAVARIELGLIEYSKFGQLDKGFELLKDGVDGAERVPRQIAARAYFGIAEIYDKRNQKSRALEYARKSYALNSANAEAKELIVKLAGAAELKNTKVDGRELLYLGDQYVRAGDYFSAQAEFKAAFEADPKNGTAAMKAAKCLWQLNQSEEAIDWLKKAISAEPQLIAAYVEMADYYAQRFDYMSAMRILQKAQQIAPRSYEVYRGFATVELRRNNFQGALTFAQRALKLYESDLDTFLIVAKAQYRLQNFQEAQRFAGKAIELDYNNVEAQSLYAKIEASLHGLDAGAEYIQKQINRYVITAGQQVPQAAIDYRVTLGEIYMQDERYAQAEEALRQAISLDPNNKSALMNLGRVLQANNRASDALEMFLRAAVLDPSDADPIFQSAQVYANVGKNADAVKQYQRVIHINSRYPKAHVELGRVLLRMNEYKKALEEAMEERKINPDLADAYLLAAEAYYSLGQYTNCAGEYQRAVAKKAQTSTVFIRMARCYRLTGALDSAQSLLRQAQSLESGNPDLYKEQGAIFHMKGMADEALAAYDTYLKLVPNASDRADIENQIRRIQSGDMSLGQ